MLEGWHPGVHGADAAKEGNESDRGMGVAWRGVVWCGVVLMGR